MNQLKTNREESDVKIGKTPFEPNIPDNVVQTTLFEKPKPFKMYVIKKSGKV